MKSKFFFIILALFIFTNKAYSQTYTPEVFASPNPAVENTDVVLSAVGCPPNENAKFIWDKLENTKKPDSATYKADNNGVVTMDPPKSNFTSSDIQKGSANYSVKVECGGFSSPTIVLTITNDISNDDECTSIRNVSLKPASGTLNTSTKFTLNAQVVPDCSVVGATLLAFGGPQGNTGTELSLSKPSLPPYKPTDSNGNWESGEFTVPQLGYWELVLYFPYQDVRFKVGNLTITDEEELKCGDPVPDIFNTDGNSSNDPCPNECKELGGFCGGPDAKSTYTCGDPLTEEQQKEANDGTGNLNSHWCPDDCPIFNPNIAYDDAGEPIYSCIEAPPPGPPCAKVELFQDDKWVPYEDVFQREYTPDSPPIAQNGDIIPFRCVETNSAINNIKINPNDFVGWLLGILMSVSGLISLILIIRSGYQLMTAGSNPEAVQEARERMLSAVIGLLFIIFALVIFEVIGVDILHLPGFGR